MKELTTQPQSLAANDSLRHLLNDPEGAYQRWRRHEAPYYEMCRAVVLAYCNKPAPANGIQCSCGSHSANA